MTLAKEKAILLLVYRRIKESEIWQRNGWGLAQEWANTALHKGHTKWVELSERAVKQREWLNECQTIWSKERVT